MTQGTRETILTLVGGPHSIAGHPQCHFPNELYALSVVAMSVPNRRLLRLAVT